MKDISQFENDIKNILQKQLQNELNVIGKKLISKAKENIQTEVYDAYTPSLKMDENHYERTYRLKNGVTKSSIKNSKNNISMDVYVDDDFVKSYHYNDPGLGQLESYADIVEEGDNNPRHGYDYPLKNKNPNRFAYLKPRRYMRKTYEENEELIIKSIDSIISNFCK